MSPPRSIALALLVGLAPAAPRANEAFLASETIEARQVPGPLLADPGAPLWQSLSASTVFAWPQRTIRLHDRTANEALADAAPRAIGVRAAFDERDLAIVLDWSDTTQDRTRDDATEVFGDAAALEFPLRFGAGKRLPYVGMGDEEMPVAVYLQRAMAGGTANREAIGAGFGSLARADLGAIRTAMRYDGERRTWRAVFVRPLVAGEQDLRRGLVPFATAVWDGARHERGGNKALSRWKFLRLPHYPLDQAYVAEMSYGYGPNGLGDPARGKVLTETVCAACHVVGERRLAAPGIAPDLTAIGAISTPGYLRDSLLDPSAVIVPNSNPSQHYDRGKPPDARGAFSNNDAFVWYRRDPSGRKVSKMPAFGSLPPSDVSAIVAYLVTLGAEPPSARRQP